MSDHDKELFSHDGELNFGASKYGSSETPRESSARPSSSQPIRSYGGGAPFALSSPPKELPDFSPAGTVGDAEFWGIFDRFAASGGAFTDAEKNTLFWALVKFFIVNTTSGRESFSSGFNIGGRPFDLSIIANSAGTVRKFARNGTFANSAYDLLARSKGQPWLVKHCSDRGYRQGDYDIACDFILAADKLNDAQRKKARSYANKNLDVSRKVGGGESSRDGSRDILNPVEDSDNAYA